MIYEYSVFENNRITFDELCNGNFGREVIKTKKTQITPDNIANELSKALPIHYHNANEINYLDKYYKGDQPILYREKKVRPEVNNKNVINLAYYLVENKTSDMVGEPIQYVLHGTDEQKSEEIVKLNAYMVSEDKEADDIELCRWRSICGTAYRYIGTNSEYDELLDETDFFFEVCDPRDTFVVYYQNNRPAYSVQIREDENGETIYNVFTNSFFCKIKNGKVVAGSVAINGNGKIPVIEYPNNARRLSDIEITITITDQLNRMTSDRSNGIEQFVASWIKFVNCAIDEETFAAMRQEGALVVKSNNGSDNKADVDVISSELNQTQAQVAVSDLFEKFLIIHGLANRQSSSGGDTKGAVELRNGHYDSEKRAELGEPIFKKSERATLRIILNRLRITKGFTLMPSDVEVKISRTKTDNILTKSECLQILLDAGVTPNRAIKTVGIWSDPEQVASESKDRMDILYPTEIQEGVTNGNIKDRPTESSTEKAKGNTD